MSQINRIDKLTDEQIAQLPHYAQKWADIGLCTEPANRGEAEKAIHEMYQLAGMPPPKKIVWCGSPLTMGMTRAIILDKKIGASVGDSVRDSVYGQHDANWLAFYRVFHDFGLVQQTEKLRGLWKLAESAGWALPHEHICWVSERHNILSRDENGRLHNISGPAVMYPDGWAIYAVHGVRVPADVVEKPEKITIERIGKEGNAEIKRVMLELYGHDRYLADVNAKPISVDKAGELFEIEGGEIPIKVVRVINSTPEPDGSRNIYFLKGHHQAKTAKAAVASTFGLSEAEYSPQVET